MPPRVDFQPVTGTRNSFIIGHIERGSWPEVPEPAWMALNDGRTLAAVAVGSAGRFLGQISNLAQPMPLAEHVALESFAGMLADDGEMTVHWHGEARVYFLDRRSLRLLTFEDVPYTGWRDEEDHPTQNDDELRRMRIRPPEPGLFVALTRGAWECWAAPWLLERALVAAFRQADNWDDWVSLLRDRISEFTRQSAAFTAIPWLAGSYEEMRAAVLGDDGHWRFCEQVELDNANAYEPTLLIEEGAWSEPRAINRVRLSALQPFKKSRTQRAVESARYLLPRAALAFLAAATAAFFTSYERPVDAHAQRAEPVVQTRQAPAEPRVEAPLPAPRVVRSSSSELRRGRDLPVASVAPVRHPRRVAALAAALPRHTLSLTRSFSYRARVWVNLRGGPGSHHRRLQRIPPGDIVRVIGRKRGDFWVKVNTGAQEGWVAPIRGYLRPVGQFSLWDIPPL